MEKNASFKNDNADLCSWHRKTLTKHKILKGKLSCKASIFKNIFIIIFVGKH